MSRIVLAWAVHAFTALGLVAAAAIAVLLVGGGDQAFERAFWLMIVATAIDALDGPLARYARVQEVLPSFDGRRLDDLIDFLNYTCLPLLLIWRAGVLPESQAWWLLAPLLASIYGFSQVNAKTDDGFFLGFPSYWNVVAFYLYFLELDPRLSLTILLTLAVLTFVPLRYFYPTQPGVWNRAACILAAVWGIQLIVILALPDQARRPWLLASLPVPIGYLILSWWLNLCPVKSFH
ncbi:MAG TPA: CDP-alcohol phosphatidyltransferase family protein [Bryobacteraceae bacterium]|nr:CDP-alcohol phosphatidyltransferase family protein [Bryobacteraceae bacterium]